MTLTDFVLARIAEREALARKAAGGFPDWVDGTEETLDGENVYFTVTATRGAGKAGAEWEPDYFLSVHEDRRDSARAAHIARWDPTAVLARCAVDRQIVALHNRDHECSTFDHDGDFDTCTWVSGGDCSTMRLMASLDVDHPDYDESWKP